MHQTESVGARGSRREVGKLFADVAEAVTPAKYQRMRRLAGIWLSEQSVRWPVVRFDIVAVQLNWGGEPSLSHLRGVF
jgi:putative endonuclease